MPKYLTKGEHSPRVFTGVFLHPDDHFFFRNGGMSIVHSSPELVNRQRTQGTQVGLWPAALLIFQHLRISRQFNEISYNAVISACEKGGKWQKALEFFQQMVQDSLQVGGLLKEFYNQNGFLLHERC